MSNFSLLLLGLLSSMFFSVTFILNKLMSNSGGHWFYLAFLRYFFTILFLLFMFCFKQKGFIKGLFKEYFTNFKFWSKAGISGFGVFYALLCYSAKHSPAWILVTSWQFTIFASLIVLHFFGKKLKKSTIYFTILVLVGISLVNISYFETFDFYVFLKASLPVFVASFFFPYGNQLIWEEQQKRNNIYLSNPFSKIFLMVLGSSPLWILLFLIFDVGYMSLNTIINAAFVSLFSGIIATALFLYARSLANSSSKIMIVDSTISGEVLFTLFAEMLFLGLAMPNIYGFFGIFITILSLVLMLKSK